MTRILVVEDEPDIALGLQLDLRDEGHHVEVARDGEEASRRALELAPAGARYVALADQDDVWDPDKLATLAREIGDARLIARIRDLESRHGERDADSPLPGFG